MFATADAGEVDYAGGDPVGRAELVESPNVADVGYPEAEY